ncbi:TPA_asm: hypothetical protein GIN74_12910 [Listeria monocytogenes]|nr:hypothetical protein [Listeria monocytogenes]
MKIDLEQVYSLDFTMGLRFHPLIIRRNLPLLYVAFIFLIWIQGIIMAGLPGNINTTILDVVLVAIPAVILLILYPRKMAIKYQNMQYLLYVCFFQLLIFLILKVFYFAIFYLLKNEISLTTQIITRAYIVLYLTWVIAFVAFSIRFKNKLSKGNYRRDSELQKKRSNLGLNLSKGMYILILGFLGLFILIRLLIGGELEEVMISSFLIICIFIGLSGVSLFPEHLFTAYCKFKFKEFHIKE